MTNAGGFITKSVVEREGQGRGGLDKGECRAYIINDNDFHYQIFAGLMNIE